MALGQEEMALGQEEMALGQEEMALGQEEEDDQARALARRECDALFGDCVARAKAAELAQETAAQAWAERKTDRFNRRIFVRRPPPRYAGLYTPVGRAMRHWDTPGGRLLVTVRLAEATLLPSFRASDAEERGRVNAFIAGAMGLSEAVASGQLRGYVVCWQQTGRWPRRPLSAASVAGG